MLAFQPVKLLGCLAENDIVVVIGFTDVDSERWAWVLTRHGLGWANTRVLRVAL